MKMGAKSVPKTTKWGQKAPPHKSELKKVWGQKVPSKCKSGGKKRHHISNCGGTLTTTYYIQGAGAPAKTKNYVNADGVYIFSGKGLTFSASCKTYKQNFWKG